MSPKKNLTIKNDLFKIVKSDLGIKGSLIFDTKKIVLILQNPTSLKGPHLETAAVKTL